MITNLHESPRKPARAVVLGAGGFIGGRHSAPPAVRRD